ncbi:glycosyltransferase [Rhodobacter phage RcKickapoo]|nr:glycosyltransferase [Rhodobacter phage RcKickapoo]
MEPAMTAEKKWTHRNVQAPRLRILIDPVYVQVANLGSSSTYNKYVSMVTELVSRGHYVYWMVPDVEYVAHPIEDHPNVGVIRTEYIQDQFVVDGLVTDDFFNMFNRIAGKYQIDVVCTSRTGAAAMIKRVLESPRFHDNGGDYTDKHYGLPMVVIEEFPQTRTRSHVGQAYWLNQCQGYLSADGTFFISTHNRTEVVQGMQDIYRHSIIEDWLLNRTEIVPSGIEVAQLDNIYDGNRWQFEKGFRVISVGRIMGVTYKEHLAWFEYLFKSGMDARLIVSLSGSLGGPMKKAMEKLGITFTANNPQFQLIENNPRVDFLKLLRTVHAGIAPMSHLDCPVGLSEAIYMGVPVIMPEADYQETFFPDYPFVVGRSDKAALLAHLQSIAADPIGARELIEPWRDKIRDTFNAPVNMRHLCDELEKIARDPLPKFKTSGAILEFLSELNGEVYTFADIVAYLRKCGYMGISIGDLGIRATWTYGRGAIHHAMRYVGYVDLCDGPEEVFMRRDAFDAMIAAKATPRKSSIIRRKLK